MNALAKKIGATALEDNTTHESRMQIKSESSNRLYVVAQAKGSGEWQCSCPGWIMKRAGKARGCKHLNAILPILNAAHDQEQKRLG